MTERIKCDFELSEGMSGRLYINVRLASDARLGAGGRVEALLKEGLFNLAMKEATTREAGEYLARVLRDVVDTIS